MRARGLRSCRAGVVEPIAPRTYTRSAQKTRWTRLVSVHAAHGAVVRFSDSGALLAAGRVLSSVAWSLLRPAAQAFADDLVTRLLQNPLHTADAGARPVDASSLQSA